MTHQIIGLFCKRAVSNVFRIEYDGIETKHMYTYGVAYTCSHVYDYTCSHVYDYMYMCFLGFCTYTCSYVVIYMTNTYT